MKMYQGMVCLAGNQIWWTWEVEDVFQKAKKGGKTAMKVCEVRMDHIAIESSHYCISTLSSRTTPRNSTSRSMTLW